MIRAGKPRPYGDKPQKLIKKINIPNGQKKLSAKRCALQTEIKFYLAEKSSEEVAYLLKEAEKPIPE